MFPVSDKETCTSSNVFLLVMCFIRFSNFKKIYIVISCLKILCVSVSDDVRRKLNVFAAPGPVIFKNLQCGGIFNVTVTFVVKTTIVEVHALA